MIQALMAGLCLLLSSSAQTKVEKYGLPAGAHIVEIQPLTEEGHSDRLLILWMFQPEKHPRAVSHDVYTCPEETRGSFYSGPTRVSLFDSKRSRIINTIKIRDSLGGDLLDLPFMIHAGSYYHVPGVKDGEEGKPKLIWLHDYNGDGKALEFALFDAEACMGLASTLIGYSERQDRVIQYLIHLHVIGGNRRTALVQHWGDYLFSKKQDSPGYWKYEVDYRGRGGSLEQYKIKYHPERERFEGQVKYSVD